MLCYYELTTIQNIQIAIMNALVALEHNDIEHAKIDIAEAQNQATCYHFEEEHQEQIEKLLSRIEELEKRIPKNNDELPFI